MRRNTNNLLPNLLLRAMAVLGAVSVGMGVVGLVVLGGRAVVCLCPCLCPCSYRGRVRSVLVLVLMRVVLVGFLFGVRNH